MTDTTTLTALGWDEASAAAFDDVARSAPFALEAGRVGRVTVHTAHGAVPALVNALAGQELQAVSDTRQDGKGRHTTTARELVPLGGGGVLVDTPGLRSIGLHDDGEGVALTFPDVEQLVASCRFADCGHGTEPGCAVQAALASGELDERRWHSWGKLQREAEWIARRTDPAARAAARKRWAATGRAGRAQAAIKRGQDPFA